MRLLALIPISVCLLGCSSAPSRLTDTAFPTRMELPAQPSGSEGQERDELLRKEKLTEAEFLRLVALQSPELRGLRHSIEAAVGRTRQAGLWPNPSFVAEFEEAPVASGVQMHDAKGVFGLAYPLILSGRIGAAADSAEREKELIEALTEARKREVRRGARQAYYRYYSARQLALLEEELLGIAAQFHATVRLRRAEKTVLELEEIKTAVELATQEMETKTAGTEVLAAAVEVRRILGDTAFDPARIEATPPFEIGVEDSAGYEAMAEARHPVLKAADREVAWIEALADLARREAIPDLTVTALYGRAAAEDVEGEEETPEREDIVDLGVEIPLPLVHRNQGRISELEALRRKAVMDREAVRQALIARVRAAIQDLWLHLTRLQTYRDQIIPEATKAVEQATSLYKEAKVLNLDVLDAQRVLGNARRQYILAQRDVASGIAELESLIQE